MRAARRHAVVEPLTDAIRTHGLTRGHFDRLIDVRAFDLGDAPPASVQALVDYAESTSSTLLWLALEALGVREDAAADAAARAVGIAWALLGLIRAMPHHLRQGRVYLPADLAAEFAVEARGLRAMKGSPELAAAVESLAARARGYLAEARALRSRRAGGGLAGAAAGGAGRRLPAPTCAGALRCLRRPDRPASGPALGAARAAGDGRALLTAVRAW